MDLHKTPARETESSPSVCPANYNLGGKLVQHQGYFPPVLGHVVCDDSTLDIIVVDTVLSDATTAHWTGTHAQYQREWVPLIMMGVA